MIRNVKLEGLETKPWDWYEEDEADSQTWIWNQLMGETAKGDTLEFLKIYRDNEKLCTGILRDATGKLKGIIPAIYEKIENDVAEILYYNGEVQRYWLADQVPDKKDLEKTDMQIEVPAREFIGIK